MEIDRYADLRSPVHAWDPRFKVAAAFVLVLVSASVSSTGALAAAAGGALLLVWLSRLPVGFVVRILKAPLAILALMIPLLLFTAGGEALWSWGFLHLYRRGLLTAVQIAVKAVTVVLLFAGFFGTLRVQTALKALEDLKVPATLLAILMFTYRYIHLYLEQMGKLLTAARLRGYRLSRGLRHLGATAGVVVTLLVRSYEQSDRVATAMRLRGFQGSFPSLRRFQHNAADIVGSILAVAWVGLLFWLELR